MSMQGDLLNEVKQEKLFAILLKRDENLICADCQAKAPTWVSLDFGVFVCMNCSGAHRHLSRSVTRVYSTKIDRWNQQNYQIMDYVGNGVANQYWEFKKPTRRIALNAQPDERVRFVTEKYIRKLYCNPKSQNPVILFLKNREKGILERPVLHSEDQHLSVPPINVDGKKQYISNGPATNEHQIQVNKEQKEINKKEKFNSVTSPSCQPMTDLLDLDDDCKLDGEENYTNFISAPSIPQSQLQQQQIQQQQQKQQVPIQSQTNNMNGNSLLDLYNKKQNTAPITNTTSNTNGSSNLSALYQNGQSQYPNQYPQSYPTQHHQNGNTHNNTYPSYNTTTAPSTNNTSVTTGTVNNQQNNNQQNNKSVDLMSLYSQSGQSSSSTQSQPQTMMGNGHHIQHNPTIQNQPAAVDKNRFQALNQMGQMGSYNQQQYYNYYQMQQGYQGYNAGGMPNQVNYQNNQWKQ